ncbi:MAG: tail fiber domain-containing protein [bacterium]|nr:tail fiber domain-containing protein [bacterium]
MNPQTKTILKSLLILIGFTFSIQALGAWVTPPSGCIAPGCFVDPAMNIGPTLQSKTGTLVFGGGRSTSRFSVGALPEPFVVSSTGDITKIKGIAYTWPSTQGVANDVLKISSVNSGTATLSWAAGGGGGPTGSGTVNKLARWTPNTTTLGSSSVFDDGSLVGVNTIVPSNRFAVNGAPINPANISEYQLGIKENDITRVTIGTDANFAYLQSWNTKPLKINNQGNNTLLNTGTGNVGVGVSPSYKFHVLGESRFVGTGGGYSLTAMLGNVGIGNTAPPELLSVGNNNNIMGILSLSNVTGGRVIIQPQSASFTTYTLTLPANDGNASDFLQTNGSGVLTWAPASGGSGESNTASNLGGGLANFDSKSGVDLRFNSFTLSDFNLVSNLISIDYINGQSANTSTKGFLTSTDWNTFNNKMTNPMTTGGDVIYGGVSGAPTRLANGIAGQVLTSNGTTLAPSWQTASGGADNLGNHIATQALQMSGFTINGSSTSSGNLTLDSTTNGTLKGNVILNPINGNVGINITTPLTKLDVGGAVGTTLGSAGSPTHTFRTDTNTGMFSSGADTINFSTNSAERMRINSVGNVGIGITDPTKKLHVSGDALINGVLVGRGPSNLDNNVALGANGTLGFNTTGSLNTAIGAAALEATTTGIGNTGIGYDALFYNTTGTYNTALGYLANVGSGALTNATALGANAIVNASNRVVIGDSSATTVGGYGAWTNYSDLRLKENVVYTDKLGLDFILKLKTASYNYKDDENKTRRDGLIAQDVQQVLKELNIPFSALVKDDDKMGTLNLSYESFVIPLINSIKELKKENDDLKVRLEMLEAKIR